MRIILKIIVFLTVILASKYSYTQTNNPKKLTSLLKQFEQDLLFSHNKASKTLLELKTEANNKNTPSTKALLTYVKALQLLSVENKPDSAKTYAKQAFTAHKTLNDSLAIFKDIHLLYKCYVTKKEYDSAVYYATKKLELANKLNIPTYIATANLAMGDVYYWTRQYNKVIKYRRKALQIAKKHHLKKILADAHIKIARSYVISSQQRTKNVLDSAIYHGKKSLAYAKQINYTYGIYKSSIVLADFLNTNKQHKQALNLIETVINLPKAKKPIRFWYNAPFYYAVILKDNSKYTEAKKITKQLILDLKPNDYRNKKSTYFFLTALYAHTKQADSSDYFLKQAIIANNAHAKSKINEKVAKLQTQYETEKKEQQITQLEQQRRLEQLAIKDLQRQRIILVLIPITLLIGGGWYVNRRRLKLQLENEQKERAKQLSELKALRAQMNPHFMFNALSSIQDFILQNETDQASEYLGSFAKLMRGYLEASKKEIITLTTETELLKLYIELEGLRLGKSFSFKFEVDNLLITETVNLPPLFIQPYIENAFKHGLIHKEGQKKLWVTFYKKLINNKPTLEIIIRDNGIGRKESAKINAQKNKMYKSFATEANQKRLKLLNYTKNFHKNINITIKDLYNSKNEATGTQVTLTILLY